MSAKITIVGDIMCEPLLLAASRREGGYDFDGVFVHMKEMFAEADYVIGNLETPLAGAEAGYTDRQMSFNSPDELAAAVKRAGIDLVSTANNHCLDRGIPGLRRTVRALDEAGLAHTGTFADPAERQEACYFTVGGVRTALIAYTYGTSYYANRLALSPEEEGMVNLLHNNREPVYRKDLQPRQSLPDRVANRLLRRASWMKRTAVKRKLGLTYNVPRSDDFLNEETAAPYFDRLRADVAKARERAELVLFYPHVGGQFNPEPGLFSRYTMDRAVAAGADAVLAGHAHIVQRAELRERVPCFYSLGNFSMSPNSVYLLHEHRPEYGLAVHLYLEDGRSDGPHGPSCGSRRRRSGL